jgi:hypothetical protein
MHQGKDKYASWLLAAANLVLNVVRLLLELIDR